MSPKHRLDPWSEAVVMNRRQALGLGAAAAGGVLLAACGQSDSPSDAEPQRGGIARVSYTDASTSDRLDPARLLTSFEVFTGGLIYDNLFRVDEGNQPVPSLVEDWTVSSDGRSWSFRLRDGVEFHDGRPLTANDAAFTVRRVLDPELGSAALSMFAPLVSRRNIRASDQTTLRMELDRPYAFLPALLSTYFMRVLPESDSPEDADQGIGTGPFRLESFEPGSQVQVARNDSYWQNGLPYLEGVEVAVIYEQGTKLQSVLSGNAHAGDGIEYSAIPTADGQQGVRLLSAPGGNFGPIVAYQDSAPFNDIRVRQALKHAINRDEVVDQVFFGHAAVSADISIPPDDPFYPADVEPLPHDPERARALLAEAGHETLSVELLTSEVSPGMADTAVVLQELTRDGGFDINVRQLPPGTYWDQAVGAPFACSFWLRQHVAFSLPLMFGSDADAAWNETAFSDQRVDGLIRDSQSTLDEDRQRQLIADAYAIINEDGGSIVPCHAERVWVAKDELQGVEIDWANVASFTEAYLA